MLFSSIPSCFWTTRGTQGHGPQELHVGLEKKFFFKKFEINTSNYLRSTKNSPDFGPVVRLLPFCFLGALGGPKLLAKSPRKKEYLSGCKNKYYRPVTGTICRQ